MVPGVTLIDAPVPTGAPPQDPVNHSIVAPVPNVPPVAVSVVLPPAQTVVMPLMPVGATDAVNGVAVTFNCRLPVVPELK